MVAYLRYNPLPKLTSPCCIGGSSTVRPLKVIGGLYVLMDQNRHLGYTRPCGRQNKEQTRHWRRGYEVLWHFIDNPPEDETKA